MPLALKRKAQKNANVKKWVVPRAGQSILTFFDKRPRPPGQVEAAEPPM